MKKFKEIILGFAAIFLSLVSFVMLFYTLKGFVEVGEKVFTALNTTPFAVIRPWEIVVIVWAIFVSSGIIFLLQLFKSIFDVTVKKMCDAAAKDIVELIEKWTRK